MECGWNAVAVLTCWLLAHFIESFTLEYFRSSDARSCPISLRMPTELAQTVVDIQPCLLLAHFLKNSYII